MWDFHCENEFFQVNTGYGSELSVVRAAMRTVLHSVHPAGGDHGLSESVRITV